ncbi:MAG TPA: queuosine precursor transporter, partial [Spirochaetia bacterium]|nr:queuosine precursor transporter [Spirochaetia bacterium]
MSPGTNRFTPLFFIITAVFVSCLIAANIVAVKLVAILGLVLPAAVVIFPITYLFGDILTEVYGYRMARLVIWVGFGANLIVVGVIWIAGVLPPASYWKEQNAYVAVLGQTPRILAGSFLAYLVGEFLNSMILSRLKLATKGRY